MRIHNRFLALLVSLALSDAFPCAASAEAGRAKSKGADSPAVVGAQPWWKSAVIYEIYPRSFADSDNNGIGDLKGITQKLDYLADLGVTALWLTPCYPSPQVDFGYDISDYCQIAPEYGTLADFDELVNEARKRGIRIIMDLVLNHTSDKHKWFQESSASKDNPYRDWFIWRDGKGPGQPPNNWQALFGHSAWQLDPKTNQYYYHFFYPQQPDLNWRNPEVRNAMADVVRFWLDRGVAGFRLDAINTLYEDPDLRDNPVKPGTNVYGDPNMDSVNNYLLLPEIHKELKELRKVVDAYPDSPVLLGETTAEDLGQLVSMYGTGGDEIQLPMDFRFAYVDKISAPEFRARILEMNNNAAGGWPVYLYSNHDRTRHVDRYTPGASRENKNRVAKLLATLLLTLRCTPVLYYGEELAMENRDPERLEDVQDPIGKIGWPKEKGRDGERTPMQWSAGANAGFSTSKPWVPVAADYKTVNVAAEQTDPSSVLSLYKRLLKLRKSSAAIQWGDYVEADSQDEFVLSFLRRHEGETVLVILNMSGQRRNASFKGVATGSGSPTVLVSTEGRKSCPDIGNLELDPYEALVLSL